MNLTELRSKYPTFKYVDYSYSFDLEFLNVLFTFEIEGLDTFNASYKIPYKFKYENSKVIDRNVFLLGLIEALSVYKLALSERFVIECNVLRDYEETFIRKLIRLGLAEYFYINNIEYNDSLITFISTGKEKIINDLNSYHVSGILLPLGGGKDSITSYSLLEKEGLGTFALYDLPSVLRFKELENLKNYLCVNRVYDQKIVKYNKEGFLNGHTPLSSIIAFSAYLTALVNGYKYVVLSNEDSANESTIKGKDINHQYSKSLEFENDFRDLMKKEFDIDIEYFSLLRPLSELQIVSIFRKQTKYHKVFTSCNAGSKKGVWCTTCAKCLFIYILLSAFLNDLELYEIFNADLYKNTDLTEYLKELAGIKDNKPFECVGTVEEVNIALCMALKTRDVSKYPLLLEYVNSDKYLEYKDVNYDFSKISNNHNLNDEFLKVVVDGLK